MFAIYSIVTNLTILEFPL